MLHMKQLNSKKTRFPRFDKIIVIQPIAEVYGEGNEQQLCLEIGWKYVLYFRQKRIDIFYQENQ